MWYEIVNSCVHILGKYVKIVSHYLKKYAGGLMRLRRYYIRSLLQNIKRWGNNVTFLRNINWLENKARTVQK